MLDIELWDMVIALMGFGLKLVHCFLAKFHSSILGWEYIFFVIVFWIFAAICCNLQEVTITTKKLPLG